MEPSFPLACTRLEPPVSRRVAVPNDDRVFFAATGWRAVAGMTRCAALLKAWAVQGDLRWQLAVQYAAARADKPDAWQLLGVEQSGSGEHATGELSLPVDDRLLVRFGFACRAVSGPAQGDLWCQVATDDCGGFVGRGRVQAVAESTSEARVAVTEWLPLQPMQEVMAAIVVTGVTGDLEVRLLQQAAPTSPEEPGNWAAVVRGWLGSGEHVVKLTPLRGATQMWGRLGIGYRLGSGTLAEGMVEAQIAVRNV